MKNAKLTLQIQGGKYKGKKIYLPSKSTTRSTKSILKGSVFDSLQNSIIDKTFVEVFGGSGSMGLEALSRGAKKAYFIELESAAYTILKSNCQSIDPLHTEVLKGDSFNLYQPLIERLESEGEKVFLYFDPPFDIRQGMEGIYEKVLDLICQTPVLIVEKIIIEHISTIKFDEKIGPFKQQKSKKFGKSTLSFYTVA